MAETSEPPRLGSDRLARAQERFAEGNYKKALADLWTAEGDLRSSPDGLESVVELATAIQEQAAARVASEAEMLIREAHASIQRLAAPAPVDPQARRFRTGMPVTTMFKLPGYEITEYVGEVFGVIVRSRGALPAFGAGLKAFVGGELKTMTNLLDRSRREAVDRMVAEAEERGADAVIAMRFDADSIADGWTEICAYGTAVQVRQRVGVAPAASDA